MGGKNRKLTKPGEKYCCGKVSLQRADDDTQELEKREQVVAHKQKSREKGKLLDKENVGTMQRCVFSSEQEVDTGGGHRRWSEKSRQ
jgi:hypothetical protein